VNTGGLHGAANARGGSQNRSPPVAFEILVHRPSIGNQGERKGDALRSGSALFCEARMPASLLTLIVWSGNPIKQVDIDQG
jgi:hypothetical protein